MNGLVKEEPLIAQVSDCFTIVMQDELPEQVKMPVGGIDGFVPYKATVDLMASAMSG
jgi:hypothetical protein